MIQECLVVEFSVRGDDCPLADATRNTGASLDAHPPLLREDGYALLHFSSANGDALATVLDEDDRVRYLHLARNDGRFNYRCLSKDLCVVHDLVSAGFLVEQLHYDAGDARFTGAVVGQEVLRGVLDTAGDTVGVTLERVFPIADRGDSSVADRWGVTPAQADALRTAHEMGYFSVPRDVDASEVAAALDISKSAFLERLRRGLDRLLGEAL
jgi:predicted DNA binding protein